jgi:hypothetical protein
MDADAGEAELRADRGALAHLLGIAAIDLAPGVFELRPVGDEIGTVGHHLLRALGAATKMGCPDKPGNDELK